MSHLTKTEMSRHVAEYCHNTCSTCPPFACIHARRRPCHSSIALSLMIYWSGQWHAKHAENAPSVQNTCLDKIVCYLQRIFNRNRKLKQQGSKKVNCITIGCVCSKIKVCYVFVCIFFQICQHSNFLLLQGSVATYWRYDGSIIWVLLEFHLTIQQWKNFKNLLRTDKVIAMSAVYYFFGTQCILVHIDGVVYCVHWGATDRGTWSKGEVTGGAQLTGGHMTYLSCTAGPS